MFQLQYLPSLYETEPQGTKIWAISILFTITAKSCDKNKTRTV